MPSLCVCVVCVVCVCYMLHYRCCLYCVCEDDVDAHMCLSAYRTSRIRFHTIETQGQADRGCREVGGAMHLLDSPRKTKK